MSTTRTTVLIAMEVSAEQATDTADLAASVRARLVDEAGYLDSGEPITPSDVRVEVLPVEIASVLLTAAEVGLDTTPDGIGRDDLTEVDLESAWDVASRLNPLAFLNGEQHYAACPVVGSGSACTCTF